MAALKSLLFNEAGEFAGSTEMANTVLARNGASATVIRATYGVARLLAACECGFITSLQPHLDKALETVAFEGLMVHGECIRAIEPRRTNLPPLLPEEDPEDGTLSE
jgi:hypothetical protein